ncbi:MAG: sialate O-acetylesterase [Bacteroidota bacterium]|nr:sialate O-acetylesterase [Bacteroidota bacterium]
MASWIRFLFNPIQGYHPVTTFNYNEEKMKRLIFSILCLSGTKISFADIRLPSVIGNNMVLQQQSSAKLWGWSAPAEKIYITTSWNNKTDSVTATRDADWQMIIQTPPAGGPYSITFRGNNQIVLDNVLIGEVWVCSGQSNMEMNEGWGLKDVKAELPSCYNRNIRFFYIPKTTSDYPQDDCKGAWEICDSNTVKNFSAAGYFFGKKLNKDLNVPVGLINSNWGGTAAEVWTPAEVVDQNDSLKAAAAKLTPAPWWPYKPGVAFNAMISPITHYSIAGAIWYQGESNTGTASTYSSLFTSMIDAWRKKWDKEFPFYYVQIAPFHYGNKNIGALLQEAQTKSMQHQNVGMVVITDLVDDTSNIHPQDKHDVGYRLANWALAETYHKEGIVYKSPVFKAMDVQKGKAIISFENPGSGLQSKGGTITELYIAGSDKIFYPANAKIIHDQLTVWSKSVPRPVAVRYAFGNTAIGNLLSKDGLPVTAFRTDSWDVDTTEIAKK